MSAPAAEKNEKQSAPAPTRQSRRRRDYYSDESSDYSSEEEAPRRRRQRPQQRQQSNSNGGGQLAPVNGATDQVGKTVDSVSNTASGITNTAGGLLGKSDKKDETLRLRLDLNLDVDIQLKARIHGDLTLALLNWIIEEAILLFHQILLYTIVFLVLWSLAWDGPHEARERQDRNIGWRKCCGDSVTSRG